MKQITLNELFNIQKKENQSTKDYLKEVIKEADNLSLEEKIEFLNEIRGLLHEISPFKNEPVDYVKWVKAETVQANDYNPNSVAPPEMELLRISIDEDGYTQPIVTWKNLDINEVVDGFHRNRVGKECKEINEKLHNYLPIVTANEDREDRGDRMAATIRHNRARGKHKIDAMSEIVMELRKRKWSPDKIAKKLGMDADEVLRLSQIGGLAELFADREFSQACELEECETQEIIDEEGLPSI
jgi:ParB-like chromosome segregation protein Spo0J